MCLKIKVKKLYFILILASQIYFTNKLFADDPSPENCGEASRFGGSAQMNLFGIGLETTIKRPCDERYYFFKYQEEGFLLVGSWHTILVGIKQFYGDSLYAKWAIGWYTTETFSGISRSGPTISFSVGWSWPLKEKIFWGIEAGGLGLNYLTEEKNFSAYAHMPGVFIGTEF